MSYNISDTLKLRLLPEYNGPLSEDYYTVSSVTTVQQLSNLGVTVYRLVYEPYGFTSTEYDLVSRNAVVYALVNGAGTTFHVPKDLLETVSEDPLVAYESKTLAISLGEHPQYREFPQLIEFLETAIYEFLGVTPSIHLLTTSEPVRISEERHLYLSALRESLSDTLRTPSSRLVQREQELEALTLINKKYKDYILNYLATCAQDCGVSGPVDETDPYSVTEIDRAAFNFEISTKNFMRNPCGINNRF